MESFYGRISKNDGNCQTGRREGGIIHYPVGQYQVVKFGMKLAEFALCSVDRVFCHVSKADRTRLREQLIHRRVTKKSPVSFQNLHTDHAAGSQDHPGTRLSGGAQ
jgi:hypothetical protein